MRSLLAVLLFAALSFAGCSGGGGQGKDASDDPTADLGLQATETTGVIRGVVVDERIVPIVGATVTLLSVNQTVESNDGGGFGFDGLEPGTYFMSIDKPGFKPVQHGVEVVAGVSDPPIQRIQLLMDGSFVQPYYEAYVLDGYIQCGVTTSAIAVAVCSIPNGCNPGVFGVCATNQNFTDDNFNLFIPVDLVPMHIQHELVWDATQSTGDQFNLAMRTATPEQFAGGGYDRDIGGDIIGTSPLLGIINQTMIEDKDIHIGVNGTGLAPAVFTGGMEGTAPPCIPVPDTPATNPGNLCMFANGATVQQRFELYTHVFFGYAPPEGWRFSEDSIVPAPPS